jgi:hypothetical protein
MTIAIRALLDRLLWFPGRRRCELYFAGLRKAGMPEE